MVKLENQKDPQVELLMTLERLPKGFAANNVKRKHFLINKVERQIVYFLSTNLHYFLRHF